MKIPVDPWPGMTFERHDQDGTIERTSVASVSIRRGTIRVITADGSGRMWSAEEIREVRAADGAVLWVRP